jgi:hypothetical protein
VSFICLCYEMDLLFTVGVPSDGDDWNTASGPSLKIGAGNDEKILIEKSGHSSRSVIHFIS